jgi:hypothetical protein
MAWAAHRRHVVRNGGVVVKPLWKTTIVIWSDFDPQHLALSDLARDAEDGESYCSYQDTTLIQDPQGDSHWDGTEFFNVGEEE